MHLSHLMLLQVARASQLLQPALRLSFRSVPPRDFATQTVMSGAAPRLGKLDASRSALLLCDIQERFRENIQGMPALIDASRRMARGAEALGIPVLVTEQYPKALGNTVKELQEVLPEGTVTVDKTRFSMCVEGIEKRLKELSDVNQIMLAGLETHVCVLQTSLDLIEQGYEVHIIVDGVSSQRLGDRAVALQRLAQAGAFLSTQEMALFQLAGNAKHPAFKAISGLAKETRPDPIPLPSAL